MDAHSLLQDTRSGNPRLKAPDMSLHCDTHLAHNCPAVGQTHTGHLGVKNKKNSLLQPLLIISRNCSNTLTKSHNDAGKPKISKYVKVINDSVGDHQTNIKACAIGRKSNFPDKSPLYKHELVDRVLSLQKKITNNVDENHIFLLHLQS